MKLGERLINYADDNDITYNHLCVKVLKINRQIMDDIINCDIYSAKVAKKIANILGPEYEQYIIPNRCQYCGKEFIGRLHQKCCCAKCSEMYRSHGTKKGVVIREVRTRKVNENVRRKPDEGISETALLAKESKKTYGYYVAMERLRVANDK